MANQIAAQIAAFRAAKLDQDGESDEKCEIVQELEDHVGTSKVLTFFLDLIADPDEYDMARLEALKILQLWQPPSQQIRTRVGRQLAEVLRSEPHVLVQQWTALAAENFIGVPQMFAAVSAILADIKANVDVRFNCVAAVEALGPSEQVVEVLEPLATDPQLGRHIRRILKKWRRRA